MQSARQHVRFWLLLAIAMPSLVAAEPVDYVRDIKPLLKNRCAACHGALKQESGLRLDAGSLIRKGSESGPVVVVANPDESELLRRVTSSDPSQRMPPEGPPLDEEQIGRIRKWVAAGATSPSDERPEPAPQEHWSFRPPLQHRFPKTIHFEWNQNPVDPFIAQQLEQNSLAPRVRTNDGLLLRRVYLDLIGLPPTREELESFLSDTRPNAFEQVVDRLLASPQYGERWARHWMDVWRYSDWHGRRMVPDVWNSAPQIWRWRDWIVRSLNEDKGYDRMVAEMLAADEVDPENEEAGYATGYLIRNWYALNPNDWMRSNVEHTGKAFLGLTLNCAHCHDHKYDPISQEDYFRFRAFFEPIGVRQDRVPGEADPGPFQEYGYSVLRKIVRLGSVRIYDKNPEAPTWFYTGGDERNRVSERGSVMPGVPHFLASTSSATIASIAVPARARYPGLRPSIQQTCRAEKTSAVREAESKLAAARSAKGSGPVDEAIRQALEAKLVACQSDLASLEAKVAADIAKFEAKGINAESLARVASSSQRTAELLHAEANLLEKRQLLAIAEAKPLDYATRSQEIEQAKAQIAEAEQAVGKCRDALADPANATTYTPLSQLYPESSTGRRKALATWIADPRNPLAARVAVNHIWLRHFHSPLVSTVYDFGRNGQAPTHPELLDWLAVEFMQSGWSMKRLHRLLVTSETYRMSSNAVAPSPWTTSDGADLNAEQTAIKVMKQDPENRKMWRMNAGRMEAEILRDSLLDVANQLDLKMYGQELENSDALTTSRRSLYYSCHPELDGKSELGYIFDAPEPLECYRRTKSIVPQQALALTNSDLIHQLSARLAATLWQSLAAEEQASAAPFVACAFESIVARKPTAAEMQLCCEYLAAQSDAVNSDSSTGPAALRESLVRSLLNHNDFITIR